MASVWIRTRTTTKGAKRYRVEYQPGGREAKVEYAGTFATLRLAGKRKAWVIGELAAMRMPNLKPVDAEPARLPTLREAVEKWRGSRIDVDERTRTNDRVNTDRLFTHDPALADKRLDELDVERWARLFAELAAPSDDTKKGYKRSTLKKSKEAFSMVYDHFAFDPNPVRDPRVKLPHEQERDLVVPLAIHVEAVAAILTPDDLLPYLVIDWTGLRLTALEHAQVRDLDEHRRALLARRSIAKNKKPVWTELHDVLFDAIIDRLPPREDRDLDAPLFAGFKGDNLRTAITRACRHTGTPHFSPHGLRKRRGSLLSKQGYSLVEVAERLGDTKVVTAEHYLYALGDYTEVDYARALTRAV
jgi:integrase